MSSPRTMRLSPNRATAEAAYREASIAWQRGDVPTATRYVLQALQLDSRLAESHNLFGLCLGQMDRPQEALEAFRKAVELDPLFTDAGINLSMTLGNLGYMIEAERVAQETSDRNPAHVAALCSFGVALARSRKASAAEEVFKRVLQLHPDNLSARRNLAHSYREQGRFAEALAAYQAVLRINPRDAQTHEKVSQMQRYTTADLPKCNAIKTYLKDGTLSHFDRACLHFTLGKIYEDVGDYYEAFKQYRRGNEAVGTTFDRAAHERYVNDLIDYFTPARFTKYQGQGSASSVPIFIVGMPRSGTTLTEQILARHPQVFGAGERREIPVLMRQLFETSQDAAPIGIERLERTEIQRFAATYLTSGISPDEGTTAYVDKMPTNFLCLGLIAVLFPHARVVHCRRDPLDVGVSCYTSHFASRVDFAQNMIDIGSYHRQYERLMQHWRKVLPNPILDVQYEELVADQTAATRKLLDFCGLSWDERCLSFHESTRPVATVSDWQVRQPLYDTSVGRWRKFAPYLGPLREALELPN